MIIAFTLSMPGVKSWNGQWSGAQKCYASVCSFRGKQADKMKAICEKGYFTFAFSDGWRAAVSVNEVSRSEAAQLRKRSAGFNGYDWMVKDIIELGRIRTFEEKHPLGAEEEVER